MARTEITFSFTGTYREWRDATEDKEIPSDEYLRSLFRGVISLARLEEVEIGDDRYRLVKVESDEETFERVFGIDLGNQIVIQRRTADDPWEVAT